MKKTNLILSILFVISLTSISVAQDKEGFELIKKEDQISIFERWINYPNANSTTQAREVKGEFTIATTVYAALKLIRNEEKIKIWQTHVSEFKVYLQPDTMTWYEYSYHDIPWPVSDQDHYLKYKMSVIKPNEQLFVTFESAENKDLAPVREDVDRMGLTGSWKFEKLPGKMIKVTYRIISKPSSIPRLFTDPVIRRNIMSTIRSYIDILEGRK
jgi:hypothetical protein